MSHIGFALLSAFFAAITSVLAKKGMQKISSNLTTALRTVIVLIFSWFITFITTPVSEQLATVTPQTLIFLFLSGITTGASWICYFHALKLGNVNVVVPIDKSSVVLSIVFGVVILQEPFSHMTIICTILIAVGTLLMIQKRAVSSQGKKSAALYALAGAVFAALTSILGKIGISGISSDLGSSIRTVIVLIMAWLIVIFNHEVKQISRLDVKSSIYIIFSGIATGASWLCYYRALSLGPASHVVPIDKLSILFTVILSYVFFREKLTWKSLAGLILIVAGTLLLVIC